MDIISQILDIRSTQHCTPALQHVYGHKDDKRTGPLTFIEHINVRIDKLAKSLAIRSFGHLPNNPPAVLLIGMSQLVIKILLLSLHFRNQWLIVCIIMIWSSTSYANRKVMWIFCMSRLLGPVLLKPANELLFRFKNLSPSRLAKIQLCVAVSKDYMIIALDVTSWKNILCTSLHAHILMSDLSLTTC